jgi:endonuclease/exonuclease/phosphatase family metal-dependent hydrolase
MTTIVAAVFALLLPVAALAPPARAETAHRVASFNIRFGTADDGQDRWDVRRVRVVRTIRDLNADVVGLQEALAFQVRELVSALPEYAAVGVHRDDGLLRGESASVLYRRTRYTVADTGTFWLSDTPDLPGSNTWGAACNRTCTWVRLVDLTTGAQFSVFNTHFDHQSANARSRSVTLLLERLAELPPGVPFVLTGDLNADEADPDVTRLKAGAAGWTLVDTYRRKHPNTKGGTFTAFDPANDGGDRKIDYVFVGPGVGVLDADIDRRLIDGRYPSDHFPVWADLDIK